MTNDLADERTLKNRGAPPGNYNALKSGRYSPRFFRGDVGDLHVPSPDGLEDEIDLLRRINLRALELADEGKPMEEFMDYFRFLALICQRIAILLRTRKQLNGREDTVAEQISKTLNEVLTELGAGRV